MERRTAGRRRDGVLRMVDGIRDIFSDEGRLQGILDFEAALARAESETGIVPAAAAAVVARHCVADRFNCSELASQAEIAGNIGIPAIAALRKLIANDNEAGA